MSKATNETLHLATRLRLLGGSHIPVLGLGVFRAAAGEETERAVRHALELGYRHIDTASIYGNEEDVGRALRASGIPREELFVTTKLWNTDQGYDRALAACRLSLKKLGLDHIDLYLIHWPVPGRRLESWRALCKLRDEGLCRAIGVSNFLERHLDELAERSPVAPEVNQIELHPFLFARALIERCQQAGIVVQAYSPLAKGQRFDHPVLVEVAARLGRSPAQIMIRWALDHGLVALPKSSRPARIEENARVFDFSLGPDDLGRLDALHEELHTGWDPSGVP